MREFALGEKLHLLDDLGRKIREKLFNLGLEIGHLRWASHRENLGLNFRSILYSQFVDLKKNIVNMKELIRTTSSSTKPAIDAKNVEHKTSELKKKGADYKHVCQGHDLVFLLELVVPAVFDSFFGKNFTNTIRPKCKAIILDDRLRLGYEKTFFISTKLYFAIKNWEQRNVAYKILN